MDEELEANINFWINGVCTVAIVIGGVILNCVSIYIIWKKYENANIFYQMLISLLCFDILVLVTWMNLSLYMAFKINNIVIMHMFPYFSIPSTQIAITASTFMTVAIAHERYLAVRDPLKYSQHMKTPKLQGQRLRLYLFIVIIISIAFNIPHFIELEVRNIDEAILSDNSTDACHPNTSSLDNATIATQFYNDTNDMAVNETEMYDSNDNATFIPIICYTAFGENPIYLNYYRNWAKLMITGVIPFLLLIFFNTYIYKAIKKSTSRRQRLTSSGPSNPTTQRLISTQQSNVEQTNSIGLGITGKPMSTSAKRKDEENLSMVFVGIVTIFLLCHGLKIVLNFYDGLFGKVGANVAVRIAGYFSNFLIVLNSAINMVIYCILNRKFRNHFLNTVSGIMPCVKKYVDQGRPLNQSPERATVRASQCQKSTQLLELNKRGTEL